MIKVSAFGTNWFDVSNSIATNAFIIPINQNMSGVILPPDLPIREIRSLMITSRKPPLQPQGKFTISAASGSFRWSPQWAGFCSVGIGSSSAARNHFSKDTFELTTEAQIGWANSCALIGLSGRRAGRGRLSDKFGRKKLLIAAALIFAVTSWAMRGL